MSNESISQDTYNFGNNPAYPAGRISVSHNLLRREAVVIDRVPPIDEDGYHQALEDINETWRVIDDPHTGKTFEVAIANQYVDPGEGVDLEMSTFTSSLSGNIGNAVELAEHSALHPDRQRLYVASFGNGKTSYWDAEEQRYIKRTGRFINPYEAQPQPLPTIAALARALMRADVAVSRISTNSAGGAYATALMHALPEGQVTHAYIKSRPNISDHRWRAAWGAEILVGDILDDRKHQKASHDPWKLTPELVEDARARLPRLYSEDEGRNVAKSIPEPSHTFGPKKLWDDMVALSRGASGGRLNPAALDTAKALEQQPGALLTYHFPDKDRLYTDQKDIETFLTQLYSLGNVVVGNEVEALIMPGTHRDHTGYPALRWSVEDYAFSRAHSDSAE